MQNAVPFCLGVFARHSIKLPDKLHFPHYESYMILSTFASTQTHIHKVPYATTLSKSAQYIRMNPFGSAHPGLAWIQTSCVL